MTTLAAIVTGAPGYADVRLETARSCRVTRDPVNGVRVTQGRRNGGHVRVLLDGTWGAVSFSGTAPRIVAHACRRAASLARLQGGGETRLAGVAETAGPVPLSAPAAASLDEMVALLEAYCCLAERQPGIGRVRGAVAEHSSVTQVVTADGRSATQPYHAVLMSIAMESTGGATPAQLTLSLGGTPEFGALLNQEARVIEHARLVAELGRAEPAPAGPGSILLDPELTGTFIHEALGHLLEADNHVYNPQMSELLQPGRRVGPEFLAVRDDPGLPGGLGSYAFDDEGTPATAVDLVREGRLAGRLHSRATAAEVGERPTGHARAESFAFSPLVRMSNIYVLPGQASLEELIAGVDDGIYCLDAIGGQTAGDAFTLQAGYGYRIRGGRLAGLVRGPVISGALWAALLNIRGISRDLAFSVAGGCGKRGQVLLHSGYGGPHMLVANLVVGA